MTYLRVMSAFARRDALDAWRGRVWIALDVGAVVANLALFWAVARLVDQHRLAAHGGGPHSYFAFAVVGVAFLRTLFATIGGPALALRADQESGRLEAALATPAPLPAIVLGLALFELLRAVALGVVTVGLAAVFFGLDLHLGPGTVLAPLVVLPLAVLGLAPVGFLIASGVLFVRQITATTSIIVSMMALLAGAFTPTKLLPGELAQISDALPMTWAVSAIRDATLGGSVDGQQMLRLLAVATVGLPLSLVVFTASMRRARSLGRIADT
jgi:ABC-type polysaccharide/polyol phosphate export permease